MASTHASPLNKPPTASSSEEEEEVSSEEEEGEGGGSSEEGPNQPAKPFSRLPPCAFEKKFTKPPTSTTCQPQPLSSESMSDSCSEFEDDQLTVDAKAKVKPIASKPMEEDPKENSKEHSTATPSRLGTKRPSEKSGPGSVVKRARGTDIAASNEAQAADDGGKKSDSKKLFQRLWSEDDEIAILKGMNEYRVKNGADPYKHMDAFHGFIKESVHVEVSRSQLTDKIWRLKKKYEKNATKGKNGEDPRFKKVHDENVFELSKQVWGYQGTTKGLQQEKPDVKFRDYTKGGNNRNVTYPQAQLTSPPNLRGVEKMHADQSSGSISSVNLMIKFSGLSEDVIRRGFESVEASKRTELEERWKNLQLLELEFFVRRTELIRDQSRLILDAYTSSNH